MHEQVTDSAAGDGSAPSAKRARPVDGALRDGGHSDEASCIEKQLETGVQIQMLVDELHGLELAPQMTCPHALQLVGLGGLGGVDNKVYAQRFRSIKKREMRRASAQSAASPSVDPAPSPPAHSPHLPGAARFSPPAGFAVVSKKDVQELERLRKRNEKIKKGNKKVGRQHNDTVARLEKERACNENRHTVAKKRKNRPIFDPRNNRFSPSGSGLGGKRRLPHKFCTL